LEHITALQCYKHWILWWSRDLNHGNRSKRWSRGSSSDG